MKTKMKQLLTSGFCVKLLAFFGLGLGLTISTPALAGYQVKALFNFGSTASGTGTDVWLNHTQSSGSTIPASGTLSQNGVTFSTSSQGNFYPSGHNDDFADVTNLFPTDGTFAGVDGTTNYTSPLAEMAASLGLNSSTIDASIYNKGLSNGGFNGHTVTIGGLTAGKKYLIYYVGGMKRAVATGGFKLTTYDTTVAPTISYVTTVAGTGTSVAKSYSAPSTLTSEMSCGVNGLVLVRVVGVVPNASGQIQFQLNTSGKAGINCLAVAQEAVAETDHEATISANSDWTALSWYPAWESGATHNANITVGATSTLTVNNDVTMGSMNVTSMAGNDLTLALADGKSATVTTYNFANAAGKTTVNYSTDSASVTAGADTILSTVGTGNLTIAANKKLTVKSGTVVYSKTTNNGTLNFDGGSSSAPINYTATGGNGDNLGTMTLAQNAYVKVTADNNKIYNVTGADDGTSTMEIYRSGNGAGTTDGTKFRKLTLVANAEGNGFWIERSNSFDATVNLKAQGVVVLANGYNPTIGSLSGSGTVRWDGSQRTLTITPTKDSEYSGATDSSKVVPFVIASSSFTQTLSGSYTGALTVNDGGKVKLTGSAQPSSTTSAGYVEVAAGTLTGNVTLNASTAVLNVITNTPGQASYSITTGDFSRGEGTVQLNGVTLPTEEYEISGKQIVKKIVGVARIGNVGYPTVAAAFAAVQDTETITLLQSVTENLTGVNKTFTLDLNGFTLSGTLAMSATETISLNLTSGEFSSTVTGAGTLVYDNALPGDTVKTSLQADTWTGTVWIKNKTGWSAWDLESYGNANSKIKLTGVTGYAPNSSKTCSSEVILEDEGDTKALTINNGWSSTTYAYTFTKLSGSGTWTRSHDAAQNYNILDISGFTGTFALGDAGPVINIGTGTHSVSRGNGSIIYIDSGYAATIASGKTWTVKNGIFVNGTLTNNGTLSGTVSGSGTIAYSGVSSEPTAPTGVTAAAWTGTVWFKNASVGGWNFGNYCNTASKVKFTGVKGWLRNEGTDNVCPQGIAELVLEDDGDTLAFELTASSDNRAYTFTKFTGSGTFKCATSASSACAVAVADVSDFTGKLVSAAGPSANPRPIYIADTVTSAIAGTTSLINVGAGETIRSGCGWEATSVAFGATLNVKGNVNDVIVSGITTAPTLNTTVTLLDPTTGDPVVGEFNLTYDSEAGAVKVTEIVKPHLGWDAARTAWTNGVGEVVTTITTDHVLVAKDGDNITFGAATTPYAFHMPQTGEVTINGQNYLSVTSIVIPAEATLVLGANAAPGFNVTGTGTLKYGVGYGTEATVVPVAKLANFQGTFWMTSGRHEYNTTTPIATTVTLKVTDGAQLFIQAGSATTWNNKFILAGSGWKDGGNDVEHAAMRVHDNITLGTDSEITFVTEGGKKGSIGCTNDPVVNGTLKGTDGFRKRGGGTLVLSAPETQATGLSGDVVVTAGTLRYGNSNYNKNIDYYLGSGVTVESGATFLVHLCQYGSDTVDEEGKPHFETPIVLKGGALNKHDGSVVYASIDVQADSSLKAGNWGKRDMIRSLSGSHKLTLTAGGAAKVGVFGGTFTGTLYLNSSNVNLYPKNDALQNATVQINGNNGHVKLVDEAVTLGALTGGGDLTTEAAASTLTVKGGTYSGVISGAVSMVVAGEVTLSGANTYSGTTTVNSGAILTLGNASAMGTGKVTVTGTLNLGTYRPTNIIDRTSTGTIRLTLTSAEKAAYDAGTLAIALNTDATEAGAFGGTIAMYDTDGTSLLYGVASFKVVGEEVKLVIEKDPNPKVQPFNANVATDTEGNWTALAWKDSSETPRDVVSSDWNWEIAANLSVAANKYGAITVDRDLALSTLNITNAGTLAIADAGDFTLTAVTIDDSASTGTTALNFALGAANVTAGADTRIGGSSTGALTVGAGKKATLIDATFTSYSASNGAFFRWNNAETTAYTQTSAAPIGNVDVTNAFNNATVTYNTGKYLLRVENGDNVTLKKSGDYIDARIVMTGGNLALGGGEAMFLGKDAGTLLDMTGGTATFSKACDDKTSYANNLSIGWSSGTAYAVTVAGGTLAVPNAYLLPWEGASITAGNGGVIRAKGIYRRDDGKTAASVSVNAGGTVEVGEYGLASDSSNKLGVTLNGGMLANSAENTVALPNGLAISADSVISNDYAMTISAPLSGAGSLTKKGTGTLTLTGANTRTGTTTIEAGTVKFASTDVMGSTAITVNDAATIKVGITDHQYASGLTLSNVTLGEGRNIIFVLPNGTEVTGVGNKINVATYWHEFNGDCSAKSGATALSFEGSSGTGCAFIDSAHGRALKITSSKRPYFNYTKPTDDTGWSVFTFARTVATQGAVVWGLGNNNTSNVKGLALASDGTGKVKIGEFTSAGFTSNALSVDVETAECAYHAYALVKCVEGDDAGKVVVYVDGVRKGAFAYGNLPDNKGQFGSIYGKIDGFAQGDDTLIDEWRFYMQAIPASCVTALAEAFPVWPATLRDSISVNVIDGGSKTSIADDKLAGVYGVLGANWNAITGTRDVFSVTLNNAQELRATGEKAATSAKVTIAGHNTYVGGGGATTGNGQMTKNYIDDGGSGASIDVEDIPYSEYTLYIYMGSDHNDKQFRPVSVYQNGVKVTSASLPTDNWGHLASSWEVDGVITLTEKENYLKVEGLTAQTLRVQGVNQDGGNRCGLAAIQIVNTGYRYTPYTAKITGENVAWDDGAGTGLSERGTWTGTQAAPQPIVLTNTVAGATLTFNTDTYASTVTIVSAADKPLTILKGDANAFNPGMFNIEGALGGVTFGYAPLNAGLAMGANVTATVSENAFGGAFNVGATASGPASSTLVFNLGQNVIQEVVGSATDANHKYRLKVVSGILNFTQGGGTTAFGGREVVADGGAAIIRLSANDATGYGTTATGIKAYNGAQIQMQVRDTFLTPIELQAGSFTLMKGCGQSSRAFDLYGDHTWTITTNELATAESPTVSYLAAESDASDIDRTVYCRKGTWTINVETNAQFVLDNVFLRTMGISGADSNLFTIVKMGLGELVLNNKVDPAGFGAPWNINAGKVTLLDQSALGTGLVTIGENGTLEFDMGLFSNVEETTKVFNIASDGSASRVNILNADKYPWLSFGTEGENLGKIVVDKSKFPQSGLHIYQLCPKPGTTAQTRDPNGRTSGWVDIKNYNQTDAINLKDYKLYRYNISKKAKPETISNLLDYSLPAGEMIRVYISEDYANAEDHGGDGDNLKVEWWGTNAMGKVVSGDDPGCIADSKLMIIPQKVNPKKYPMVTLCQNTESVTNGVIDQVLVPCDLDDAAIVELSVNTNKIERYAVQKGVRTEYGPDVSPVYGVKDTKTDLELLNKRKGFVPADKDYWLTLPINPFVQGTTPDANKIQSVQIEYRTFGLEVGESHYAETTNRVVSTDAEKKTYGAKCQLWEGCIPQSFLAGKAGQLIQFRAVITDKGGATWIAPRGLNKDVGHMWYGFVVQPETTTVVDAANKNMVCLDRLQTFLLFVDSVSIGEMDKDILNQDRNKVQYGARVNVYDTQTHTYYDNVRIDLRGQTSAGFVKKSHGLRFSKVAPLACKDPFTEDKIESRKTSFVADYGDPTALRQSLSCRLLGDAGVKVPFSYPVRLYLNGEYYQLASHSNRFTDELVEDYYGLSPKGYGYKNVGMFMPNTPPASRGRGCEKKTPDDDNELDMTVLNEYTARLAAAKFNEGSSISEADKIALTKTVMTNFNIAAWVNYLAAVRVTQENDDVWTNLGGYINKYDEWDNPNGDDTLMPLAYDLNLSWGQWFYNDDAVTPKPGIYATNDWFKCHPFYGGWQIRCHKKNGGTKENANYAYETLYQNEQIREMFLRRFRTLMDTYLGAPGTPKESSLAWQWVVGYTNVITGDIAYDHDKWEYSKMGTNAAHANDIWDWTDGAFDGNYGAAIDDLWNNYFVPRRQHLYDYHAAKNAGKTGYPAAVGYGTDLSAGIPEAQSDTTNFNGCVYFTDEFNKRWNDPDYNYCTNGIVQLCNVKNESLDLSGWSIGGAVDAIFPNGTVIPAAKTAGDDTTPGTIWIVYDRQSASKWLAERENGTDKPIIINLNKETEKIGGGTSFVLRDPDLVAIAESKFYVVVDPTTGEASAQQSETPVAGSVDVPMDWIDAYASESVNVNTNAQGLADQLVSTNHIANGIAPWQSYVLGLIPDIKESKPVILPVQTTEAKQLNFKLGGIEPADQTAVDIKYKVWKGATPGAKTTSSETVGKDDQITITLPESGVEYYLIEVTTPAKTK